MGNWFAFSLFVVIGIFAVWQLVLLIKDIKARRKNKSAVADKKVGDDLKGDK